MLITNNGDLSGEGYEWRGDTLVDAQGHPTDYTFPDEHTAISRWLKDSTQMAGHIAREESCDL